MEHARLNNACSLLPKKRPNYNVQEICRQGIITITVRHIDKCVNRHINEFLEYPQHGTHTYV